MSDPKVHTIHMENGSSISFKGDWGGHVQWLGMTEPPKEPTVVMALDFHDSQPVKNTPPSFSTKCKCGTDRVVQGWNIEWNCKGCGELCGILAGLGNA
jgi:hypothetical protein